MKVYFAKSAWTAVAAVAMVAALTSCGGSDGTVQQPPPPPPPPLAITTSSLPGSFYSEFYSATLEASGGTGARTWSISSGALPAGLNLDPSRGVISGVLSDESVGIVQLGVTVRDAASGVATRTFNLTRDIRAPRILTTTLPDAVVGVPYRVRIATTQPAVNMIHDITQGPLPPGIILSTQQTLTGVPTSIATPATFTFTLQMFTTQVVDQRTFTIRVVGQGANSRNENPANAPLISNGTYFASISPLTDPATSTVATADHDFYRLTAPAGSTVSIEITAQRTNPKSPLDSVIELVDSSGTRLSTCDVPGQSGFTSPCLNDDNTPEGTLDSKILFRAPGGAPFFLHVLDWRGDGRPDMLYSFQVFGAD
jgi:hypothetical protein